MENNATIAANAMIAAISWWLLSVLARVPT